MKQIWICLLLLAAINSEAQEFSRYIIRLKDKAHTPYTLSNPSVYLSQLAIDRRTRYGIAVDSTDFPLTPRYLDSIRSAGSVIVLNSSRWLNQVSIQTTDAAALEKISAFPFVVSATAIAARRGNTGNGKQDIPAAKGIVAPSVYRPMDNVYNYGATFGQINIHNGQFLHNIGLQGQGMIIGMLDGGFFNYTTLRAFDSVNRNGQVLGTYDFVARETSVVEDDAHGMYCFSVIAGNIPEQFVGAAPKSGFYLFRTEDVTSEYRIEEHNWVCGAERLDSAGGDVLSSSLGYTDGMSDPRFDYTYSDLNGRTTIAARGASFAARKGLLVLNSAGNQGNESFRYVATPADADSVLAVGATSVNGNVVSFSSHGPTADGRIKPDVASVGSQTAVAGNVVEARSGTSFACPNMAGLATCLWQGFREFNNMKIFDALRRSGNKATAPDNRTGYGIPDVKKAVLLLLKDFSTVSASSSSCKITVSWTSKDITGMLYEIERKAPGATTFVKIGEKAAVGEAFSTNSYQFEDNPAQVQEGTILYRIRQIIDTSLSTGAGADYLDTVSVNHPAGCTTTPVTNVPVVQEEYTVMPNPVNSSGFRLRITTPTAIPILMFRIVDSKGSIVATRKESKGTGEASFHFSVNHLAKGSYYVLIYNGTALLATREFIRP